MTPSEVAASAQRPVIVGMADVKISDRPDETLITYALGSCLGIVVHDPVAKVAGLLHVMLPSSQIDEVKAAAQPAMFVDTGVPLLFRECYRLGARKERMTVTVAGGSFSGRSETDDTFQIGKRNMLTLRKLLWKNGVLIHAEDTGGVQQSRTMSVIVSSGVVQLRTNGTLRVLSTETPAFTSPAVVASPR
ncbi:MAG TPA: chemotaxis protein CheD [Gemmatimonadaceae bacterium]|nr:chemotaxis protein CheD [Gemmatimonadaceae bacterium]